MAMYMYVYMCDIGLLHCIYENLSWDSLPIVEIATGREMVLELMYLVVEVFYDK